MVQPAAAPKREAPGVSTVGDLSSFITRWHRGWSVHSAGAPLMEQPIRRYELGGLDIVHCVTESCSGVRTRSSIDAHDDTVLGLLTVLEGREVVELDGEPVTLHAGQSLLWDTRSQGSFSASENLRKFTVFLPRDLVAAWTPHLDELLAAGPIRAERTLALRALAEALDRTPEPILAEQPAVALGSAFRELLFVTLDLAHRPSAADWADQRWRRAVEFVEDRLPGSTTAEELATHLSLSVRAVYQMFADREITLRQYVRERRLYRARAELVSELSRPIGEIAGTWGFADQSAFTKAFRRMFGETPGNARRR
ncbi:helix-turn-helix domain-containing protein [Gordonia sp. PP30]|uniref:helix-turn-helix domain-containing protein n=1 Tax=unclassified Gordonia (in: high G+C Gram-positive bacteria) TaxID=2657482 RepID=UPI001FFFB546|nr:helix-turn-helix domain-containing protein [Gordonia sp. PP30]UQE75568.1 helix-turn-helix domain-containing protein [Gordonia sp. PP30]